MRTQGVEARLQQRRVGAQLLVDSDAPDCTQHLVEDGGLCTSDNAGVSNAYAREKYQAMSGSLLPQQQTALAVLADRTGAFVALHAAESVHISSTLLHYALFKTITLCSSEALLNGEIDILVTCNRMRTVWQLMSLACCHTPACGSRRSRLMLPDLDGDVHMAGIERLRCVPAAAQERGPAEGYCRDLMAHGAGVRRCRAA